VIPSEFRNADYYQKN